MEKIPYKLEAQGLVWYLMAMTNHFLYYPSHSLTFMQSWVDTEAKYRSSVEENGKSDLKCPIPGHSLNSLVARCRDILFEILRHINSIQPESSSMMMRQ